MKFLFNFSMALVILGAFNAQAQIKETEKEVRFELSNTKDARQIYQFLGLPILWGDKETGKLHSFKYFSDKTGTVALYADLNNGTPRVIVSLQKTESTDLVEVAHDEEQSRVVLYEQEDADKLFNSLLVKEITHGGYVMRTLANEALNFSVTCMKDLTNGTGTSCQVFIFRDKTLKY